MKKMVFVVLLFALAAGLNAQTDKAQDEALWFRMTAKDYWTVKQAGYTIVTWDSLQSDSVWSAPFRTWDYMSAMVRILKDSIRIGVKLYSGIDTTRTAMAFGRTLEWDQYNDADSTYISGIGYYNSNLTEQPCPVHMWGRLVIKAEAPGVRVAKDDSLFTVFMTGRK